MHDFTFYNPVKVLFGRDANEKIADELAAAGTKKVLFLYGGGSIKRTRLYDKLVSELEKRGIASYECGGVKSNPVLSKAHEAVRIIRENGVDAILAVGGGSVIDSAKAIAAGAKYDGDLWDFYERKAVVADALPIYVVVTVSATASEMNYTTVLTNEALGLKVGLSHELLFPKCAALDPTVQFSVPEQQTVEGGIDAICHVLETYFDGTPDVEVQMEYAEGLVRSMLPLIPILRATPDDYEARAQFAWAAMNALNGTTWAGHPGRGDFASHAMGHALSAKYDSVHGATLSVLMPFWMKHVMKCDLAAFVRFAENVFGVSDGSDTERAQKGIDVLRQYFADLGAPTTLRELGVPKDDLPGLADVATRNGPIGFLKKLPREDVLSIYEAAY